MPDYILYQPQGNTGWLKVPETVLPNEATLQELVKEHPETLPLDDIGGEPLLIVGRESSLGNGAPDVIGVDSSGLVTVIECKLDRNPEVKRTVIGQVLGYGAYLWGLSYDEFERQIVRPYFENPRRRHRHDFAGVSLGAAMERFRNEQGHEGQLADEIGDESDWSQDEFRRRLQRNLADGVMRLVIVVDKVNDELRHTVEFLNECTGANFQIVCAELRYFATGGAQVLAPTLVGAAKPRRPDTGPRPNPETFLAALAPDAVPFFKDVLGQVSDPKSHQGQRHLLYWGEKGFSLRARLRDGRWVSYARGYPPDLLVFMVGDLPLSPDERASLTSDLRAECAQLRLSGTRLQVQIGSDAGAVRRAYSKLLTAVMTIESQSAVGDG
jgi:hypothetical protein